MPKRHPVLFIFTLFLFLWVNSACTPSSSPPADPPTRAETVTLAPTDAVPLTNSPTATRRATEVPSLGESKNASAASTSSPTAPAQPTRQPTIIPSDDPWMISLKNYQQMILLERLGGMPLGGVYLPVFSPDGKWLLVPGTAGTALYEADTMTLRWNGVQRNLGTFAPDGSVFYFMSKFGEDIEVRRVPDGEWVKTIPLEKITLTYPYTDMEGNVVEEETKTGLNAGLFLLSPDTGTLAGINDFFRTILLWDVATGKHLAQIDFSKMVEHELDAVSQTAFSADGSVLFIGMNSGAVFQVNLNTGEMRRIYRGEVDPENYEHSRTRYCEIWTDNGTAMASFCIRYTLDPKTDMPVNTTYTVRLVDTNGAAPILESWSSQDGAAFEGFIPGAKQAVMHLGAKDEVWDFSTGKIKKTPLPSCSHQYQVFAPLKANRVASLGRLKEGKVDICELSTGTKLASLQQPYIKLVSVAIGRSGDGYRIAAGDCKGVITFWDARSSKVVHTINAHTGCVTGLAFNADGRYLVSGGADQQVKLWDMNAPDTQPILTYNHPEPILDVAIAYDGSKLASVSASQIQVWNADGKNIQTQPLTDGMAVSIGPDGWLGYMENEMIYWDDAFQPKGYYQPEMGLLVTNSKITSLVVNNMNQRKMVVLDAVKSSLITEYETTTGENFILRVGLSPDGCLLIAPNNNWGFDFWKTDGFEALSGISYRIGEDEFDHSIADAAISHDGHLIVLAGADGALQVWGLPGVLQAPLGNGVPQTTCGEIAMPTATPVPTETPIPPTTTPMTLTRNLYLMDPVMRGDDVLALQKRLQELGYTEVGEPDGVFGKMTDQAVRNFQKDNGLVVDGIVGPKTWEKLFAP